jgi:hypothetical protein
VTASALLGTVITALEDAGIPCMLTGSMAAAWHGAKPAKLGVTFDGLPLWLASLTDAIVPKVKRARPGCSGLTRLTYNSYRNWRTRDVALRPVILQVRLQFVC